MRKFLALVLALVMTMSLVTISAGAATDFTDDAKITNAEAVEVLNAMGVLGGYADGSFRPEATLTRGAGAKLIAYLMLGQAKADKLQATYTVFEDVTDSVGLAPYIEWAAANGIVGGYGDGNFGPYNTLTEYAFGKMLLAALGYDAEVEGYTGAGWQKAVYRDANFAGIYDGTESYGACTRDTAARLVLGALKANVVAYGTSQVNGNGAIYWNGHMLNNLGAWDVAGRVETDMPLWTFYDGLTYNALGADTFGRPGHFWSYGLTFSKFYMDAPVAEYTTAVTDCQILADFGFGKTSKATVPVQIIANGTAAAEANESHQSCNGVVGGQGVLTQLFEVVTDTDNNGVAETYYVVTTIDTYLAQVDDVRKTSHKVLGQTDLTVYIANNNWRTDDDNKDATVVADEDLGFKKLDYVLVNLATVANVPEYLKNVHTDYDVAFGYTSEADFQAMDADNYVEESGSTYHYVGVVGAPTVIVGATYSGCATDFSKVTVNGVRENVAAQYELSTVAMKHVVTAADAEVVNFFVDQYGNMIGDAPYAYAYTYGVISAAKWMDPNSVMEAEYAEVKIHDMANPNGAAVKVKSIGTQTPAYGTANRANALFSDIVANNVVFSDAAAKLGIVKNYGDGKLEYVDGIATYAATVSFETKNPNMTGLTGIYANNSTEFLVKKSATEYVTYTGIDSLPSMTNAAAVAVVEANANYACFVYIDATNAVYSGSQTVVYVADITANYVDNSNYYEYSLFVNGAPATLYAVKDAVAVDGTANGGALFTAAGLYKLTFNAAGLITKAENGGYTAATTVGTVEDDYKLKLTVSGTTAGYDVSTAKIYVAESLTSTTNWATVGNVIVGTFADIANGQTVLFKLATGSTYVVDTIYVLDQVVEYTK